MTDKNYTAEEALRKTTSEHLKLFGHALSTTEVILKHAQASEFNEVQAQTENRKRLIRTIELIQEKIEKFVEEIPQEYRNQEVVDIVTNWENQTAQKIEKILELDNEIVTIVSKERDKIHQEISYVFEKKTKHKGYDLSNVKR